MTSRESSNYLIFLQWLHWGIRPYFSTLRDVYRYLNSLQFSLPVIPNEIDITDFLVLEAIRLNDFDVYQQIFQDFNQSMYLGNATLPFASDQYLDEIKNKATSKLLRFLFPKDALHKNRESTERRLYDPKFFGRYFSLQISTRDIAESEFKSFMELTGRRAHMLSAIYRLGRLENLLIRLNDSILLKKYPNWDFELIKDLFEFFDKYARELDAHLHRLGDTMINLLFLKEKNKEKYFSDFLQLLVPTSGNLDYAKFYFLHYIIAAKNGNDEFSSRTNKEFIVFAVKKIDKLEPEFLKLLKNLENFYAGKIIQDSRTIFASMFFLDYAKLFPREYEQRLPVLLNEEENLIFFLKELLTIGVDGKAFRVRSKEWNLFFPTNYKLSFLQKVKNMDISALTDTYKQWREFALENMNNEQIS